MIRVLIVDDDKLVRKGLASSMPWKAFGMEIVGEANNGENALKFMESNPIDLLMTDLSMPVMSGIELMRAVRDKYPLVQIVVLSLHQDFEYVQEALRLGAIDYIAKIQLEQEQFEEVLGRIVRLMGRKEEPRGAAAEHWATSALGGDELYVYYSLSQNPEETLRHPGVPDGAEEAEPGIWYSADPPAAASTGASGPASAAHGERRGTVGPIGGSGSASITPGGRGTVGPIGGSGSASITSGGRGTVGPIGGSGSASITPGARGTGPIGGLGSASITSGGRDIVGRRGGSGSASASSGAEDGVGSSAWSGSGAAPGGWPDEGEAVSNMSRPLAACVRFIGLSELDRKSVLGLIRSYGKRDLFYDYRPDMAFAEVDASACLSRASGGIEPIDRLKERWAAADWISDDAKFEAQLAELKELRMPPVRLIRIFYSLTDEWNRLYQAILEEPIAIEDFFPGWFLFEEWLTEARDRIRRGGTRPLFSQEIQNSIVKAMSLVQINISEPVSSSEIAAMVNMSGSYFSQCFKQYVGQTYTDYVRHIRMERAKDYLRSTNKTIGWVAEQIGYHDEKYFSRLFREHVGILPSEFRQQP